MAFDQRLRFIQNKVQDLLEVDKSKWDELIARDEKKADADLREYVDKGAKGATAFFLYQTVIEYEEQKPPPQAEAPPAEGAEGEGEAADAPPPEKPEPVTIAKERQILSLVLGRPPDMKEEKEKVKLAYFVLRYDGPVSFTGKSVNDAAADAFFYGTLNSRFLIDLKLLLHQVFLPSLALEDPVDDKKVKLGDEEEGEVEEGAEGVDAPEAAPPAEVEEAPVEEVKNIVNLPRQIHEEILGSTTKFLGHVKQAAVQVYVNVNIKIPAVDLEQLAMAQSDMQLLATLEASVNDWSQTIEGTLRDESNRQRESKYPMAEIEYWRDRASNVSTLYEQLQLPAVQRVLQALQQTSEPQALLHFKDQFQELQKMQVEAKDNVKFLQTLERHFKNLENGSLQTIVETLPSLLNAIRMVWIISRYFNTDEYMEPLMKRIAEQIADKVEEQINVQTIFSLEPSKAMQLIQDGKAALDKWESAYLSTRERIEESGTDHRWEFDRPKLFKITKYMSKICRDLWEIAHVLDQFYKFLGSELKEVTGDAAGVDDLIERVRGLTSGFKTIQHMFEERFKGTWDSNFQGFKTKVEQIENKAIEFLDARFQNLRSAEGAFQLLQNFKNTESREKINKKMNEKFVSILEQYNNEVRTMRQLFLKGRHSPPTFKNTPPVAGAILWARSIFHRLKRPVLSFKTMPHLLETSEGQAACKEYVELGKEVLKYEDDLFDEWQKMANKLAVDCLKYNILARDKNGRYYVNFAEELQLLIREAKYLDQMGGFDLPHTVLNVSLQQEKYKEYVEQLELLLQTYRDVVDDLSPVQRKLLSRQIQDLDKCFKPGLSPKNWNSLGVPDFLDECNKGIAVFRSVRDTVEKSEERIEAVVEAIRNAELVRDFDWKRLEVMDVHEFFDFFERHRQARVDDLVKKYDSIAPFLIKIEETTAQTKTGAASTMADYYLYWERRIFNAITTMLIRGMASFQTLFKPAPGEKRPPLVRIKADFNPPEVVIGTLHSVFKLITKLLQNILWSANNFIRWMHQTCRVVPPQSSAEDEAKQLFTFYRDISQNTALIDMTMNIQTAIQRVFQKMNKFLRSWKKYDSQWGLWDSKRKQDLDKITDKKPNIVYFDVYICVYKGLAEGLSTYQHEKDIGFVRIDSSSVISGIRQQALEWAADYGRILNTLAKKELEAVEDEIRKYYEQLQEFPSDLEKLKFLLNVISQIKSVSMDMVIRIWDIQERYRTLQLYSCAVDPAEVRTAFLVSRRWQELKDVALTKDARMENVKKKFAEVTSEQVVEFAAACKVLFQDFRTNGPGATDVQLEDGVELMKKFGGELASHMKQREELVKAQTLFNLAITSYPELSSMERELKLLGIVYDVYVQHVAMVSETSGMLWGKLDVQALAKASEDFEKKIRRLPKDNPEIASTHAVDLAFHKLEEVVMDFKNAVPLIQSLKHDSIKPVHWEDLMQIAKVSFEVDLKKMTLAQVFQLELHRFPDEVNEIVTTAQNELKIENDMQKIETCWRQLNFQMIAYKDRGMVLLPNEEMRTILDDQILTLQSMGSSKYAAKLLDAIKRWEKNLNTVGEVFDAWINVQRKWMYLESIFLDSDDIRLQLPEEAKKFDKIHKTFKLLMQNTVTNPNALAQCCTDGRLVELKGLMAEFDRIQKSLTDYLDTKRSLFPRFYFISDDELLSILGSSDPTSVQQHMLKLFDNCKELIFSRPRVATGMISEEGEKYDFHAAVKAEGPVEEWMNNADDEMKDTLLRQMKEAVFFYAQDDRVPWVKKWVGMVALAGTQIWWTWSVEDTFRKVAEGDKNAMKTELALQSAQLDDLVVEVRAPLSKQNRKSINTLIILDVHARDVVDKFVRDSILSKEEFAWESQLRFSWDRRLDDIMIYQCTGKFRYCYEYQGLNGRLVITPLTDRCVMTLTTALTFLMGGAPAGPAGTGKTETVKDLAKALALRCVVTNCGDGLDYRAMGVIFSGLSESGFWGCFDEFNRINPEVLSVVATQIKTIQIGLAQNKKTIDIGGRDIGLVPTIGYYITMNPGYAGRSELPDNLKALFRPVVMIVPDLQMICENMLMSEGFSMAKGLAKKMTVLYSLAQGQLSKQYHYDFKLRALKSVLVMAGDLKRASAGLPEDMVLMRALRDMNMPKFVKEDVPLFQGLLGDLFPGLDCPRVGYPELRVGIDRFFEEKEMKSKYDDIYDLQVDKVMQLYETMLTRHSTMITGPSGGGKSVCLDAMAFAQKVALNLPTTMYPLNPKAIPTDELYGVLDPATRDWTDGLLSKIFRDINSPIDPAKPVRRYIFYDGDVDAIWIENMNSVMDDNKLLTLTNGERIRLEKHCAMLFENFDLQYASPATISRCGMVFVDDKNLGPGPYYDRWCRIKGNDKLLEALEDLYEKYVPPSVMLVFHGREGDGPPGDPLGSLLKVCLGGAPGRSAMGTDSVVQLCSLFDAMVVDQQNVPMDLVENVYIFCVIWSLGSVLNERGREKFDEFTKKTANKIGLPTKQSLYDSFFDIEQGRWISWDDKVPAYDPPANIPFVDVFVPTVDTTRYAWLQEQFMSVNKPCLYVGESGTAKSVTVQACLDSFSAETSITLNINYSSRTSSLDFQKTIEDNISKRTGRIFGPEQGKKLRVFVDDLSMPKVDTYGTQQPLALLRFLIDRQFVYERGGDLEKIIIQDLQFCSAMQPPGSGRNPIDSRLVSLYACVGITFPSVPCIDKIFVTIMRIRFQGFGEPVQEAVMKLPGMTMQLHNVVQSSLPPTPLKFHYVFNLRDLSRVSQGVYQADPQLITTAGQVVRLWRNEVLRVYEDRLNDEKDKDLVGVQQLPNLVKGNFGKIADEVLASPIVFGDFRDALDILQRSDTPHLEVRLYEDLGTFDFVKEVLNKILTEYNETQTKAMSLVLFQDAMQHLMRVHRIIRMSRGNAMLIGLGGSGKQSMTRLATFTAGYKIFEITLSRGYGDTEFRDDLRLFYSGVVKAPLTFLFMDCHVLDDGFLEYINNMLTVGMVPALFGDDEKEPLVQVVRPAAKEAQIAESGMWNFCCSKIRDNMHLCIAMSPAGAILRNRCRNFPGLVSCNTIDWFFAWPKEALMSVASFYIENLEVPDATRAVLPDFLSKVHLSVTDDYSPSFEAKFKRKNFATPKNYLDYLNNYNGFLDSNRKKVEAQALRLSGGLEKLIEAADQVAVMSKELATKLVVVDQKKKDVAQLLEDIAEKSVKVSARQEDAAAKSKKIEEDSVVIEREKAAADVALEAALPALAAAAEALESLDKKDIGEIKGMASPPTAVMIVCMCVVILRPLGKEDESAGWAGAKAMLSDMNLLRALQEYKKDEMKDRQIKRIKDLVAKEKQNFEGDNMLKISKAGHGLLQWVKAMVAYHDVAKEVEPKRKLVKELQQAKDEAEEEMERITAELEQLSAQISALTEEQTVKEKLLNELKSDAESMQRKLNAASQLIEGLGSERERWTEELKSLDTIKTRLDGDCLLTAAFVSYSGAFNMDYRQQMVYTDWLEEVTKNNIPRNPTFRLETLLTSDIEVAMWSGQGLPQDELSVQNGILTTRSSRWPLCVDPQMQAVNWLKRKEEKAGLIVKTLNDEYIKHLELALQYGKPMLFENLDEELDPMLDPVLEKNYVITNGAKMITLGDNTLEWNEQFQLYLTTKLSNPRYSPETMGKVSIVNYMVTLDGLAAQLLNVVVGFERPDLEKERQTLVQTMSDNKQVLKTLEDTLLKELAGSKVPILENDELIATLNTAKTKSVEIGESLVSAAATAAEMEKTRSLYEKVARRGSVLYFAMQGMPNIEKMYEYSLSSYLGVFETALQEAKPDRIIDNRLKNLREKLTQSMYDYTCLGTFEVHKLLFSFKMTTMIMAQEGELIGKEFDFLLKGNPSLDKITAVKPYDWITDTGWKDLQLLQNLDPVFKNIVKDLSSDETAWRAWYDEEAPEGTPIPGNYSEADGVDPFKQMLVIRCFRTDRIVNAVKNFICWRLNDYYVQPPSLVYDRIFAQSSEKSPICFILSPGADPLSSVQKLGETLGFSGTKFKFVSLGQGMGPHAASLIDTGYQRGHWVVLQNCHLLTSWLKSLEKILEGHTKPHKDYRLWLTTLPLETFPLGILQKSLKVVTEPPDGLRLNMRQSYTIMTDADLDACAHWAYKPLVFVLAFYHAVVQDRRKFGRIGWNVAYDFNESDFRISVRLIAMYLDKALMLGEPIPWETLRYLIGEAMYGGRVTDDFDRRVLNCYLEEYKGDFLFDENQPFFFSQVGYGYNVPRVGDLALYQEKIKAFPMVQPPAVFGMHSNAEITYLTTSVKNMWDGMLAMQTGDSGGSAGGGSREDYILKLATDIQQTVPDQEVKFLKEGVPTPQEVVLMQELERFIRLSDRMYNTLTDLKRAVSGEIGMSADLEELGNGLFNARVYAAWLKIAPQSTKPLGSWIEHYRNRYQQYKSWAENGDPKVYWLSGLHIPESLLSALVQATSRRKNWALDKSTLYTTCTKYTDPDQVKEPLLDGAYVRGLILEGARWDLEKGCLATSRPKELVTEMPIIEVIPVEANRLKIRDSLATPVYVTPLRRNAMGVGLVFTANLTTKEHLSIWILQGVALVLNDDS